MKYLIILLLLTMAAFLPAGGSKEETQEDLNSSPISQDRDFAVIQGYNLSTGDPVGPSMLQGNDVTLINIWATTCPACIRKLPELARLETLLPDKVGMLGITLDGASRREDALTMLSDQGTSFLNMAPHEAMSSLLYRVAPYIPATVLVDSSGNILSGPSYGLKPAEEYLEDINSFL